MPNRIISVLKVFDNGGGSKPDTVKNFVVMQTAFDKRSAWLKWRVVDNA